MAGLSNYAAQAVLNALHGKTSNFGALASAPTIYLGLHGATTLASAASTGASSISVDDDIGDAATVTLDPGGANEETHSVASVSGSGPYTVNLDGTTLANDHASGVNVGFPPTEDGANIKEPSGGAYARVATAASDWNEATLADPSVVTNAAAIDFGTATADWLSGVKITHAFEVDASSAGNMLASGPLSTAKPVLNGDPAKLAAGSVTMAAT